MPAQKKSGASLLGAILGTIGFSALAGLLVTVMVAPAIAMTGITANNTIGIFDGLPEYIQLGQQRQKNEIYIKNADGTDQKLATMFDQNREEVSLDQMSDNLKWAAIAGEDRRFYTHGGVDPASVGRAAIGMVAGSADSGGASTLSMQTVRNILVLEAFNDDSLTPEEKEAAQAEALEPTAGRKLKEMKLAIGLEKEYTKDEILQGYLNIASFGRNTYGVQAAALQYFGVAASDVTVAQAASLLAIVQYPSALNLGSEENWPKNQIRRDFIVNAMLDEGYIDQVAHDEAIATPVDANFVRLNTPANGCMSAEVTHRTFCDYVLKQILAGQVPSIGDTPEAAQANWKRGGYKIFGTLDIDMQVTAHTVAHERAPGSETRFDLGAAASSVEVATGRILVMAQNKDFDDTQDGGGPGTTAINYNTDHAYGGSSGFQPGSTYKPFTLLAWLDAGRGINESFDAGKLDYSRTNFADSCSGDHFGGGKIRNDEGERGSYSVTRGTAKSTNSVFYQMASKLDQCDIRDIARAIGVHDARGAADGSDLETFPSCVLGGCKNNIAPLTMAASYAAIANHGVFCKPIAVDRVVDASGAELPGQNADCHQAIRPEVAHTASYAMQGVMAGTAGASRPSDGTPYFGKTGTTQDAWHTWMVGSSSKVATAVWVGNATGQQSLRKISVAGNAAQVIRHRIFKPVAEKINSRLRGEALPGPDNTLVTGMPTFVPDVMGQTVDRAKGLIETQELSFADGGPTTSDQPAGTIVRVDPGAGASVPKGTTVTVFTSDGLGKVAPNVAGLDYRSAANAFRSAGFSTISETCVALDSTQSPQMVGKVVLQDPAANAMGASNGQVNLAVLKPRC